MGSRAPEGHRRVEQRQKALLRETLYRFYGPQAGNRNLRDYISM